MDPRFKESPSPDVFVENFHNDASPAVLKRSLPERFNADVFRLLPAVFHMHSTEIPWNARGIFSSPRIPWGFRGME